MFLNSKIASCVAFVFIIGSGFAQTKYKSADTEVRTSLLGKDTVYSNKSLTENISGMANFSRFTEAVEVTGIESSFKRQNMYTYFIPENSAFSKFTKKEIDSLFKRSNPALKDILLLHAIPGRVDKHSIEKAIEQNNGDAYFQTLGNKRLHFRKEGESIVIISPDGSKVYLKGTNYRHSNGFFHVVDNLVIPGS